MACHKPHVLVLSLPAQGHVNPLMQISTKLVSHGLYVTFVIPESHVGGIKSKGNIHNRTQDPGLDVRVVGVEHRVSAEIRETTNSVGKVVWEAFDRMRNMQCGVDRLIVELQGEERPPTLVLADAFVSWAQELTDKFGIPLLVFFASNATTCSILYHSRSLKSQGILPFTDENGHFTAQDMVTCIPGIPPIHPKDFIDSLTCAARDARFQFCMRLYEKFKKSYGIVINTFEELETTAIEALREELPIYTVGPLLLLHGEDWTSANARISYCQQEDHCVDWLDMQPTSSILYISFGSLACLSPAQTKDLALALEATHQPFLWVIPQRSAVGSLSDVLPQGFLSATRDWGLIISGAPQVSVLAHPSVAGFLSHCGWNSIIENISSKGVPMICWPQFAEQRMNCRLLVDEWKIGKELMVQGDGVVGREEVERALRCVMHGEEGRDMKSRAEALHTIAKRATQEGGTSHTSMEAIPKLAQSNSK